MQIYILLGGAKGPFSLEMVREMLTAGTIHDMTLIAPEGGMEWRPAGIFLKETISDTIVIRNAAVPKDNDLDIKLGTMLASRKARIAAALALGLGILFLRGRDEGTKSDRSVVNNESPSSQPQFEQQYVSRAIYDLYMEGYQNPAAAQLSREMLSMNPSRANTEGGMKDRLIVLGADDRIQGNPVRMLLK